MTDAESIADALAKLVIKLEPILVRVRCHPAGYAALYFVAHEEPLPNPMPLYSVPIVTDYDHDPDTLTMEKSDGSTETVRWRRR